MKSNELFEKIHAGQIEDNTKIEVMTEEGTHIAFITYQNQKLNWTSGEFDTRFLCDINTEFEIVEKEPWKIEKLKLEDNKYVGERLESVESKVNEIIDSLNKINEPLPF